MQHSVDVVEDVVVAMSSPSASRNVCSAPGFRFETRPSSSLVWSTSSKRLGPQRLGYRQRAKNDVSRS